MAVAEEKLGFRRASEADVDSRRRISLGRIGHPEHKRYEILENDLGEILLVPLVSMPAREAIVWQNAQVRESIFRGMEQASRGELIDRGSFLEYAEYAEDGEDEEG
jgi:hypothetical protein